MSFFETDTVVRSCESHDVDRYLAGRVSNAIKTVETWNNGEMVASIGSNDVHSIGVDDDGKSSLDEFAE